MKPSRVLGLISLSLIAGLPPWPAQAASPTEWELTGCHCWCPPAPLMCSVTAETVAPPDDSSAPEVPPTDPTPPEPPAVRLNELLPDPDGLDAENEFVELVNQEAASVNLKGWRLTAKSTDYVIEELTVSGLGHVYWRAPESGLTLGNSGGFVELHDSYGQLVDRVEYPSAKTGQSWAHAAGETWRWTELLTPGGPNAFPAPVTDDPDASNAGSTDSAGSSGGAATDDAPTPSGPLPATGELVINELIPDPTGSDEYEWIELHNRGSATIDLAGWQLDDMEGGSSPFTLDGFRIAAEGYLLINKPISGLALNNGGDQVRLFTPNDILFDQAIYQEAPTGQSLSRFGSSWQWTEPPTPGEANEPQLYPAAPSGAAVTADLETAADDEPTDTESAATANESPSASEPEPLPESELTPIGLLPDLDDDEPVAIRGTVSLVPGHLGKTIFMMQALDGLTGTAVRLTTKDGPELQAGQIIELEGKLTRLSSGWRVSAKGRDTRAISAGGETPTPIVSLSEVSEARHGTRLQVEGVIASRTSTRLRITDQAGSAQLDAWLTEDTVLPGEVGDGIRASGTLNWKSGQGELVVVKRADLKIDKAVVADTSQPIVAGLTQQIGNNLRLNDANNTPSSSSPWPLVLAGAVVAGAGAWAWLNRRRQANLVSD
jgi:hypothetical protein